MLEKLDSGGFGDVFRALDPSLGREVALKLLRPRPGSRETSSDTVIREGQLLARVKHPNVMTVYGAQEIDGQVAVHPRPLRHDANAHARTPRRIRHALANELDLSRVRIDETKTTAQRGRLACAIGPEQAKAFAGTDFEIQTVDGIDRSSAAGVAFPQVAAEDGGFHAQIIYRPIEPSRSALSGTHRLEGLVNATAPAPPAR